MGLKSLILGLGLAAVASATPMNMLNERAACNADYCLRAIRASQFPTRLAQASADCSTFVGVTNTPAAVTVTSTVNPEAVSTEYVTVPGTYTVPDIYSGINTIPPYAATCSVSSRLASACSCIGVTTTTGTAPTPTVTVTETNTDATVVTVTTFSPTVRLPSPTPILINGYFDDTGVNFTLPFPIKFYNKVFTTVGVSVNGLFGFTYADYSLGDNPLPYQYISPVALAAFWDDLIINAPGQGIYYEVTGSPGGRSIYFEYILYRYNNPQRYKHFLIKYEENNPNVFYIQYWEIFGTGSDATIGMQSYPVGVTYSSNQEGAVPYNTILKFDSVANTIVLQ